MPKLIERTSQCEQYFDKIPNSILGDFKFQPNGDQVEDGDDFVRDEDENFVTDEDEDFGTPPLAFAHQVHKEEIH